MSAIKSLLRGVGSNVLVQCFRTLNIKLWFVISKFTWLEIIQLKKFSIFIQIYFSIRLLLKHPQLQYTSSCHFQSPKKKYYTIQFCSVLAIFQYCLALRFVRYEYIGEEEKEKYIYISVCSIIFLLFFYFFFVLSI